MESKQQASDVQPKVQLQRSHESAQLLVGEKPGEFEVVTAEGKGILVISEDEPIEVGHPVSITQTRPAAAQVSGHAWNCSPVCMCGHLKAAALA